MTSFVLADKGFGQRLGNANGNHRHDPPGSSRPNDLACGLDQPRQLANGGDPRTALDVLDAATPEATSTAKTI